MPCPGHDKNLGASGMECGVAHIWSDRPGTSLSSQNFLNIHQKIRCEPYWSIWCIYIVILLHFPGWAGTIIKHPAVCRSERLVATALQRSQGLQWAQNAFVGRKKPKKVSFAPQLPLEGGAHNRRLMFASFSIWWEVHSGHGDAGCKRFDFDGDWEDGEPPLQK